MVVVVVVVVRVVGLVDEEMLPRNLATKRRSITPMMRMIRVGEVDVDVDVDEGIAAVEGKENVVVVVDVVIPPPPRPSSPRQRSVVILVVHHHRPARFPDHGQGRPQCVRRLPLPPRTSITRPSTANEPITEKMSPVG